MIFQDDEGFQSMVKEMTESQKVAALKAYRNSLIDQSEAVSDPRH